MLWSPEREVIIDPFVLALVWSEFAPRELRRLRKEEGESGPTENEEDQYIDNTSNALFGSDSSRYPLDFLKSTLLLYLPLVFVRFFRGPSSSPFVTCSTIVFTPSTTSI
jgi:hypothetical protein